MGFPSVRSVLLSVELSADEVALVEEVVHQRNDAGSAWPWGFDRVVAVWAQLGVEERIQLELERRYTPG